ncbi:AAA family ATPase [Thomasclavelia saccharogumia]|uniref:AAA family ATPase n=1 Tax=Thomasclavelia saccharogumia TaxID=341225 RepID=UPI00047C4208|nr:AAA family ATPase [Thomasclavelia saccharogumia]
MENIYVTNLKIKSLRHLHNIEIPLSDNKKNLILTGKNGSGKTSVLDALSKYLDSVANNSDFQEYESSLSYNMQRLDIARNNNDIEKINDYERFVKMYKNKILNTRNGLEVLFNVKPASIFRYYNNGEFVLAYYKADRIFQIEEVKNVEKVNLNDKYSINEKPSSKFVKYLVDLKVTQALALTGGKKEKAEQIENWFKSFEDYLKVVFDEKSLKLVFDEDAFHFYISMNNRDTFDFNTLSSGYSAILDIVVDLIMRMEKKSNRKFEYNMPGIVLIDEIETHLHLELQKNIMSLLTTIFPNIQFIVTTHSPFILNSLDNVVIYDLENHILIQNGLTDVPYKGVVEGYFKVDSLSKELKEKFEKYKELVKKEHLEDEDFAEIARLQVYLEEIPDYLALDISTEYQNLKLEFEGRSDLQ